MSHGPRSWIAACLIVALAGCAPTGGDVDRVTAGGGGPSPFLEDVQSRVVTSTVSGREYQISVALPLGYADSTDRYPVLYALDANGQFGMVVETARMLRIGEPQIPELVIVGVGYPSGGRQINARPHRVFDLSPTRDLGVEARRRDQAEAFDGTGGGVDFLRFVREELFPLIDDGYRTDRSDRALYGHSAGGSFGFYALLAGEGAFQRLIIGSPALWWDDGHLFKVEDGYAKANRSLSARVFLSAGMNEPDEMLPEGYCPCMVQNVRRLAEILERRKYEGLEWQHHVFEDENHQSVVPATISRGLRFIYASPR